MEDAARAIRGTRIASAALVVTATLPLSRLFTDGVLGLLLFVAACSLGVTAASRKLLLAPIIDLMAMVLGLFWLSGILFARDTLLGGVLPGAGTWRALQELIGEGADRIVVEVAPIKAGPEVLLFVVIGVWATAWLVDTSVRTLGSRLLAIGAALPLLITPGMLVRSGRLWWDAGAFLAAAGALLWTEQREGLPRMGHGRGLPAGPAIATLAVAGALLVALVPQAPGFGEPSLLKSRGNGGVAFNPITALRPTLNSKEPRNLFTVRASRPGYYKLTVLDEFDGETFRQSGVSQLARSPFDRGPEPAYPASVETIEVGQVFSLSRLAGSWLPAQSDPVALDLPFDDTLYEADTGALLVLPSIPRSAQYRVLSEVPRPNARMLDSLPAARPDVPDRFLKLPRISGELRQIAADIVGDAGTPYRQAVAIQDHLREFTYDLDVAATHDLRTMEQFLTTVRRGYCEQFATTMAVLARILGIPSRVVVGFGPGKPIQTTGDAITYQVTTLDAHAWPEIWLEGAGWLRFEPTPRSGFGSVPAYTTPPSRSTSRPDPGPTATPTQAPTVPPTQVPSVQPTTAPRGDRSPLSIPVPLVWAVVAVALSALTLRLWLIRGARRHGDGRMPPGYRAFLTFCADAGLGRLAGETPGEHADRLAAIPGIDARPLRDLAGSAVGAIYGPPGREQDLGAAGHLAREAVGAILPPRRRMRAAIRANLGASPRV